jgi:hypothetical protein
MKQVCQCRTCREFRSKGITAKFSEQECLNIRKYVKRMMRSVRTKYAGLNGRPLSATGPTSTLKQRSLRTTVALQ